MHQRSKRYFGKHTHLGNPRNWDWIMCNEDTQLARLVICKGVDPNERYHLGTPLYEFAYIKSFRLIQLVLSFGVEVNKGDIVDNTPLHEAYIEWDPDKSNAITLLEVSGGRC